MPAGRAEVLGVVAALVLAAMADLQEELPLGGELQDLVVAASRCRLSPHVVFVVDEDPVLGGRPFVAGAGSAERADEFAVGIEFENRRAPGMQHSACGGLRDAAFSPSAMVAGRWKTQMVVRIDGQARRPDRWSTCSAAAWSRADRPRTAALAAVPAPLAVVCVASRREHRSRQPGRDIHPSRSRPPKSAGSCQSGSAKTYNALPFSG